MTNSDNTIPAKKEVTISLLQSAYETFGKEVRDSTPEQFMESVLTQKAYEIKESNSPEFIKDNTKDFGDVIETFYWESVTHDSPTVEGREIAVFRDARTKRIIRQEYVNSYTNNSIFIFQGEVEVPIGQLEWLAPTV